MGLWAVHTFPPIVRHAFTRTSCFDIGTPDDAAVFLEDPAQQFGNLTEQELLFLEYMRDGGPAFFTDTEFVTHISLLVQVAVVNSKREIVFSSYIHHGCATVEDIWRLALEKNGKPLVERQAKALRRAFGPPSQQKPRGESLNWLAEQWWLLKQQHPA